MPPPEISIIIATNRNHADYSKVVVDNINSLGNRRSYEICVVSQEPTEGENVRWIEEKTRLGPIAAFNYAVDKSEGNYVVICVDDHVPVNRIDNAINFLESNFFDDRKYKITSLNPGAPCYNPVRGDILGDSPIDFDVGRYPLLRFPIFDKQTLKLLGGKIFHPAHYYHSSDIFLSYWLGKNGEPGVDGPCYIRGHRPTKDSTYEVADCNISRELIRMLELNPKMEYLA